MSATNPLLLSQRSRPNKNLLTGLSRFQRILMVTDGTVTELLEQYLAEKILVSKLFEKVETQFDQMIPSHKQYLAESDLPVLKRAILLEGQNTKQNWIYAESSILLDNLNEGFRSDLLASREPIGRLWEKYRYETFKTILDFEKRPAEELAGYFDLSTDSTMISRTYSVYSGQKPIMIITEIFPGTLFQD
jgi:chorismate-pyruvate lyase